MTYDPDRDHRRSIRLIGYDYTREGAYFVTICTQNRVCMFGDVVDGTMRFNEHGKIVREEWFKTARVRPDVVLHDDELAVMPNHIHGIIRIVGATRRVAPTRPVAPTRGVAPIGPLTPIGLDPDTGSVAPASKRAHGPTPGSIGSMIGQFKSISTKRINILGCATNPPLWQRNYYEHVIRDEASMDRIRQYIIDNPVQWANDSENPLAPDIS